MILRIIIFIIINFIGLGLGSLFTNAGVASEWYASLNKAPWTPPGWVFGAAWTTIMICFGIYMAYAWDSVPNKKVLLSLYAAQWILNFAWNPIFFHYHNSIIGLVIISLLTVIIGYMLITNWSTLQAKSILLLPYFCWLLIATSLNAYIWAYN